MDPFQETEVWQHCQHVVYALSPSFPPWPRELDTSTGWGTQYRLWGTRHQYRLRYRVAHGSSMGVAVEQRSDGSLASGTQAPPGYECSATPEQQRHVERVSQRLTVLQDHLVSYEVGCPLPRRRLSFRI